MVTHVMVLGQEIGRLDESSCRFTVNDVSGTESCSRCLKSVGVPSCELEHVLWHEFVGSCGVMLVHVGREGPRHLVRPLLHIDNHDATAI